MIGESTSVQALRQASLVEPRSTSMSRTVSTKDEGKSLPVSGEVMPSDSARQEVQPTESEIAKVVESLSNYVQNTQRELQFSVDEGTGRTVIRVLDKETQETIRQIPSEEILTLARHIAEMMDDKGGLLQVKA